MGKKRKPRGCLIILIVIAVFILGSSKGISMLKVFLGYGELDFKRAAMIEYQEDTAMTLWAFEEGFAVQSKRGLKYYDLQGQELWTAEEKVKDPLLQGQGNTLIVVDKEKGDIYCYDLQGKKKWTGNLQRPVSYVVANEKYTAIFSENEESGGEVYVLDEKGKQQGSLSIGKGHVMDLALSKDSNMMALSVMNLENNKIETNVILYNVNGKLLGGNKYDNQIVTNLFFDENNKLLNVGNQQLMVFGKEEGLLWEKDLEAFINRIKWNQEGYIILSLVNNKKMIIDSKNRNNLLIMNMKGEKLGTVSMEQEILGLDTMGNHILAFAGRTLYYLSKDGKNLGQKKINNDIKSVHMLSKDTFIVVLNNKIEIMKMKYKEK